MEFRNPQSAIRNSWSRRAFLRLACGGVAGFASSSWLSSVAAHAAATGRKYKSCILLFMRGGPSHIDPIRIVKEGAKPINELLG